MDRFVPVNSPALAMYNDIELIVHLIIIYIYMYVYNNI